MGTLKKVSDSAYLCPKTLKKPKFIIQGSQKKHVRYATSQKEMVKFPKKYDSKIGIVME